MQRIKKTSDGRAWRQVEFERASRYRAQMKHHGVDDDVFQADDGMPRNVEVDAAHQVPDPNWELGIELDRVAPARR